MFSLPPTLRFLRKFWLLLLVIAISGRIAHAAPPENPATRLADPQTAEQLQLTDEQRSSISKLLEQRTQASAGDETNEAKAELESLDQQLLELLTDDQRKQLMATPGVARLRFTFREQKWIDVLDWFARQADLSLVVNDPPTGTFTYSDSREYSPKEALDLLNGVLITRGFTLIHRERMLVCVDLKQGVPDGMIPRVRLEELDQRGDFEMVQVMFPLGAKPAQEVSDEITPLLEPNGKATVLPQTRQILVTATAGKMRAISTTIASIPEPKKPDPPPQKPPEPKPELAFYPIETIDGNAAVTMIKEIIGNMPLSFDANANQISVFATPDRQQAVAKLLENMQSQVTGDNRPVLQVYPIEHPNPTLLSEGLKAMVPEARVMLEADPLRLIVYGRPQEQVQVQQTLEKLEVSEESTDGRQPFVYEVRPNQLSSLAETIRELYPKASVVTDSESGRLVVLATADMDQAIQKLVDQLESPTVEMQEIRVYSLPDRPLADIEKLVREISPQSNISQDTDQQRLLITAKGEDHLRITELINSLVEQFPQPQRLLRFYDLPSDLRARFDTLRSEVDPPIAKLKLLEGSHTDQFGVVATEAEHERLALLLDQIKSTTVEDDRELRVYPVTPTVRSRFVEIQPTLGPSLAGIRVVNSAQPTELAVWARASEHDRVKQLLDSLQSTPTATPLQLVAYAVKEGDTASILAILTDLYPDTRIVADEKSGRLLVWTTAEMHEQIGNAIKQMDVPAAAGDNRMAYYPLGEIRSYDLLQLLEELVPEMTLVTDRQTNAIIAWGNETDHQKLAKSIEEFRQGQKQLGPQVMTVPVGTRDPEELEDILDNLVPRARIVADRRSRTLIVWGDEEDLAAVRDAIKQLEGPGDQSPAELRTYDVQRIDTDDAVDMLRQVAPEAEFSYDRRERRIFAWAPPATHERIQQSLEQMDAREKLTEEERWTVATLKLESASAEQAQSLLESAFPELEWLPSNDPGRIVVRARAADLPVIEATVRELAAAVGETEPSTVKVYSLNENLPDTVMPLIDPSLTAGVSIIPDPIRKALIVRADAEHHGELQAALDEILKNLPKAPELEARVYRLQHANPAALDRVLRVAHPLATIAFDQDARSLIVTAMPEVHQRVAQTVQQLDQPSQAVRVSKVYPIGEGSVYSLQNALASMFTDAAISADSRNRSVLAVATEAQHAQIAELIKEFVAAQESAPLPEARVYRLQHASPWALDQVLRVAHPSATIAFDREARSLIVTAEPDVQEQVAQTVQQLDQPSQTTRVSKVYSIGEGNVYSLQNALESMFRDAAISADSRNHTVLAVATEAQHAQIAELVKEFTAAQETAPEPEARVYRLEHANPSALDQVLSEAHPTATIAFDQEARSLIVTAEPDVQEQVAQTVQQLDQPSQIARVSKVYPVGEGNVYSLQNALESMFDDAAISTDVQNRTVLAVATEAQHVQIAELVKQFSSAQEVERQTRVYAFEHGDVSAAQVALSELLPRAIVAADVSRRALIITARATEHQQVAAAIKEMDLPDAQEPTVQAYVVTRANLQAVYEALDQMYDNDRDVSISVDTENRSILARAPVEDQKSIAQIVARMENGAGAQPDRRLIVYPLTSNADASILDTLEALFEDHDPEVQLSLDEVTRQLVAVGTAQQHELIRAAVDQFRDDPRFVEVYSLQSAYPTSIELSISRLFEDETNPPIASSDSDTQQLFVRGTREQLDEVRQFLIQMGELPPESGQAERGKRVVPFRGDLEQALKQIESIWPRISNRPLKIVYPGDYRPSIPITPVTPETDESETEEDVAPSSKTPSDGNDSTKLQGDPPGVTSREAHFGTIATAIQNSSDEASTDDQQGDGSNEASLVIVPGQGTVTLLSDDDQVLAQAESLLRQLARQSGDDSADMNFSVYALRNAGADQVAKLLEDLVDKMPFTARSFLDRMSIVSDERLNALIVHGRRSDRESVEQLLQVLDSDNVPESLANAQPRIVEVRNADAARIMEILEGVYASQLKTGGTRPPITIPRGVPSEVATVLQQMNAAASGPLLMLEVDETTNSIVVLAPKDLAEEVISLIEELDTKAESNDRRRIGIIPLKSIRAEEVEDAVQDLMRRRSRR